MDWFSILLVVLTLTGLSIAHIVFIAAISGKEWRIWQMAVYFFMLCIIQKICVVLNFLDFISVCIEITALYVMSRWALRNRPSVSWVASVLAVYVTQLSFGIMNAVEVLLMPPSIRGPLLYLLIILATVATFMLSAFCYAFIRKFLSLEEESSYIWILLLSGLFFCAAEFYIMQNSYVHVNFHEPGKHLLLLMLQVMGLGALCCTLYAYGRARCELKTKAKLASLSQAAQAQKTYIAEAQMRYGKTRSFRHDIKNHLSVLGNLLNTGQIEEAKDYLEKLEYKTAELSFPYQTGNPVVDVLLGEKMELARLEGIETAVSVILPRTCGIDDFDLCVIFANALDNALEACSALGDARKMMTVRGEGQGDYYMLEFDNSCAAGTAVAEGIGLSNVRAVAEKYHGAMQTEYGNQRFRLNVLLNLSLAEVGRYQNAQPNV